MGYTWTVDDTIYLATLRNLHPEEMVLLDQALDDVDNRAVRGVLADWYADQERMAESEAWMLLSTNEKRPMRLQGLVVPEGRLYQVAWVRCPSGLLFEKSCELRGEVFDRLEKHWLVQPAPWRRQKSPFRSYRHSYLGEAVCAAELDFVQAWCKAKTSRHGQS